MNILIIFGNKHNSVYSQLTCKKKILNKMQLGIDEAIEIIEKKQVNADKIVIDDGALETTLNELKYTINNLESLFINKPIIFITRRLEIRDMLTKLQKHNHYLDVHYNDQIITTWHTYNKVFIKIIQGEHQEQSYKGYLDNKEIINKKNSATNNQKKSSLLKKIFTKQQEDIREVTPTSTLDKKLMGFSKGLNRVIAITGHRGIGCTSTAINIAYEASTRGLNTMFVDMDIKHRSLNLYCSNFIENHENNNELASSLIRCLAKPQEYKHNTCYINNKLQVTGLAYEFNDTAVIDRFYTVNKFVNMLTILRQNFNVVVIDIPLEVLSKFEEAILHIDTFGLCSSNNLYSIVTTLRNISTYLSKENIAYLNGKSKLIVTKYNDRMQYQGEIFTAEQMSELFASDLSDDFNIHMPIAGVIRYTEEFDMQIETDISITESNSEFKEYYSNILLRLLEGAR